MIEKKKDQLITNKDFKTVLCLLLKFIRILLKIVLKCIKKLIIWLEKERKNENRNKR